LEAFGIELETPAVRIRRVEEVIDRVNAISGDSRIHVTMAAGGPGCVRSPGVSQTLCSSPTIRTSMLRV